MEIEPAFVALVVVLPFLVLLGALFAALLVKGQAWTPPGSVSSWLGGEGHGAVADDAVLLAAWFALTAMSLWCGFIVAFVVVHALLFTFGDGIAAVAIVASGLVLAAIPFAWALAIRHEARVHRVNGHRV